MKYEQRRQEIGVQHAAGIGRSVVLIHHKRDHLTDPVSEEPTGESQHAGQKVITFAIQESVETEDGNREIGLSHFVLKRTVGPTNLCCQERPEDKMHDESIDTIHA